MADNTRDMRGNIPQIAGSSPYQAVPYEVEGLLDPVQGKQDRTENKNKQGEERRRFQPDFEARDLRNSLLENIRSSR